MATNPPVADAWQSQPSIIIDPSIYVADASSDPFRTRVLGALGTMVWATAAGLVISVTVFAITLSNDWLVHGLNHEDNHLALRFALGQSFQPVQPAAASQAAASQAAASQAATSSAALPVAVRDARREQLKPLDALMIEAPRNVQAALAQTPESFDEHTDALLEVQTVLKDAYRHMKFRRYDDAELAYREILATRPNHPGALSGMARIKLARGQLDQALALARRAVNIAPAHAVYHAVLADVLRGFGEPAAADLEYETAARLSQGSIDRVKALPENPYTARAQAAAASEKLGAAEASVEPASVEGTSAAPAAPALP